MPEGPFGNIDIDGPIGDSKELLLTFDIFMEGQNAATFDTPENMNNLSETIADASGYVERNITVFRSDAPATGSDFVAIVKPGTAEYWKSIDRSVDSIIEAVNKISGIRIEQPVPVCDRRSAIIRNNTSGRFM